MAFNLTPEQKDIGQANFRNVSEGLSRRGFMKSVVAGAAVVSVGAAAYFGYQYEKMQKRPVRVAVIGTGDEGGVLVGEHNPDYLEIVAICDIRPTNQKRIFAGQPGTPRKGLNFHYGKSSKDIEVFTDYKEMLDKDKLGIEAVVIALPLHLHAPVAIECMNRGKHVLCEKLMAWNITQCKKMITAAEDAAAKNGVILSIGHQRHYSMLYAQATEAIRSDVLGDIKHIRALWHRNNTWPRLDKNGKPEPGKLRDSWRPEIAQEDLMALQNDIQGKWGYKSMEELVRWRLFNRTGGGLMAELGSHQLDACSIFLTANAKKNYPGAGDDFKLQPLAVSGVGGKYFYTDDREVEDHVYVTFEFPGPTYYAQDDNGRPLKEVKNKNDVVVVTYSSINTNGYEPYGECLMGTRGTMIVEEEQRCMLWSERDPNLRVNAGGRATSVTVAPVGSGAPVLESSASSGGPSMPVAAAAGGGADGSGGPVSRGYREEMEHFAYCIRMLEQAGTDPVERKKWLLGPRCHGKVAMADAIIALTSNLAMKKHQRIEFKPEWFEPKSPEVPDADMKAKKYNGEEESV